MEGFFDQSKARLPAGQQLIAAEKWPVIGEQAKEQPTHGGSLVVDGSIKNAKSWTIQQLRQFPQIEIVTDIHCVTRWSKFDMRFGGVLLEDILQQVDIDSDARFVSFIACSRRDHSTSLSLDEAIKLKTLVALTCNGRLLPREHGGPIRSIVPGKYFYKSLKWLQKIELLREDRLGYWEAESGYHNSADPWLEQRYMAPTINKQTALKLIESRDFSGQDLRSIDAQRRILDGLKATEAVLRNANFSRCCLRGANFDSAHLANADFRGAILQGATFIGADLEGANFCGADLRNSNLKGASLFGATFTEIKNNEVIDAAIGSIHPETKLDRSTLLPENWRETLSPEQQEFVFKSIK